MYLLDVLIDIPPRLGIVISLAMYMLRVLPLQILIGQNRSPSGRQFGRKIYLVCLKVEQIVQGAQVLSVKRPVDQ